MADYAGVTITQAAPRSAAGIAAFRDHDRVRAALCTEFGMPIPTTPGFIAAGGVTISCLAPGRYLATATRDANLAARLAHSVAGVAAITDQSDLWEVFTLAGFNVRETLARLVPIDVDASKFGIGHLALTRAGHLHVRLWRLAEQTYELAVARSYADDLRYALMPAGASVREMTSSQPPRGQLAQ